MKPSNLEKNDNFSGRINKEMKKELRKLGMTEQKIIDAYIDSVFKVSTNIELKHKGGKK